MPKQLLTLVVVTALMLGVYAVARGQADQAQPARVAVVNLETVIQNSTQRQAQLTELRASTDRRRAELAQRREALQSLNAQLDPLAPGSDAWSAKRDEIEGELVQLEVWQQMNERQLERERDEAFARIYESVNEATQMVAREMGYDLVLQGNALPQLIGRNMQQLQSVAQNRKVIYHSEAIDITDAVASRVNTEYESR